MSLPVLGRALGHAKGEVGLVWREAARSLSSDVGVVDIASSLRALSAEFGSGGSWRDRSYTMAAEIGSSRS